MNRFHRDVRRAVERLGANDIDIILGVKHSALFFTYAGCRHRTTIANTPGGGNALKVTVGQVRRELTRRETMNDETTQARTVQDSKCSAVETPQQRELTGRGTVVHRESNRVLEFNFPAELGDCLEMSEKYRAERAGQDWMILPGGNSTLRRVGSRCRVIVGEGTVAHDLPYFAPRDAEYLASGGQVLVRLLEPVSPIIEEPVMEVVEDLGASHVEPTPRPITVPDLRALLDALRRAEAETPWRIARDGDKLLWLARIE